jgi:hypothetical protein
VHASGDTADDGLITVGSPRGTPAQVTVRYTRPTGSLGLGPVLLQLNASAGSANDNGAHGKLAAFDLDIAAIGSGGSWTITLPACGAATCSMTFHVGAQISVQPTAQPAQLTFPLTFDVRVLGSL